MKKRVTLYYNAGRKVWTHDASGHSFVTWDDAKDSENTFDKVKAGALKAFALYFEKLPGHTDIKPEDIELVWQNAPERFQPPPVEVQLTHFNDAKTTLAADADRTVASTHDAKRDHRAKNLFDKRP